MYQVLLFKFRCHLCKGSIRAVKSKHIPSAVPSVAQSVYFREFRQKVFSPCGLYNVHEKSLIEGECELNYQKHRGQRWKKDLFFLHISTI